MWSLLFCSKPDGFGYCYSLLMATQSNSRPSWKFNALLFVSHVHNAAQHSTKQIKLARYFRSFNGFLFSLGDSIFDVCLATLGSSNTTKIHFWHILIDAIAYFILFLFFFSRVVVHKFHSHISCYEQFGSSFFSLVLVFIFYCRLFTLS